MRTVPIVRIDRLTDSPSVIGTISLPESLLNEIGTVKPDIKLGYSYKPDDTIIKFALIFVRAKEKNETNSDRS